MKQLLVILSLVLLLCELPIGLFAQQNKRSDRPNILLLFSDDHAYQAMSAYGNKLIATPIIDRLANAGAKLTNNFVTNSICGPSRATLLTSRYSHLNGYKFNEKKFDFSQEVFQALMAGSINGLCMRNHCAVLLSYGTHPSLNLALLFHKLYPILTGHLPS